MKPTFSRATIIMFIAAAAALFALTLIFSASEEDIVKGDGAGPGVRSASAVGYAGLYDTLRGMDLPVAASTRDPLREAGSRGTLVVAEPMRAFLYDGYDMDDAKRLLLVLPKWEWTRDRDRPSWVSSMRPAAISDAQAALAGITIDGSLVYRENAPEKWTTNEFSFQPRISGVAQMLHPSDGMRTLVGAGDGALVAEISDEGRTVWILTDPDVMANHGITKGDNAAFMANLLVSLSKTGNENYAGRTPIVFDETIHGFKSESDSLLKMMMSFPFAIVTILTFASAVLFAAAGAGRFGVPEKPRRALDFGKVQLIDNSARLLDYGGHHSVTLGRYARMTILEAARALHAPEGLDGRPLAEWADRVGRSRKVSLSCMSILDSLGHPGTKNGSDIPLLVETARKAHQWKGEILNGSSVHRRHY